MEKWFAKYMHHAVIEMMILEFLSRELQHMYVSQKYKFCYLLLLELNIWTQEPATLELRRP